MPESAVEHPASEPTRSSLRPRRRRSQRQRRHKGLRGIYFAMAAVWGCIAGSAGVLAAAASGGQRLSFGGGLLLALGIALVAAIVGGLVSAAAYREARNR